MLITILDQPLGIDQATVPYRTLRIKLLRRARLGRDTISERLPMICWRRDRSRGPERPHRPVVRRLESYRAPTETILLLALAHYLLDGNSDLLPKVDLTLWTTTLERPLGSILVVNNSSESLRPDKATCRSNLKPSVNSDPCHPDGRCV